MAKNKIVQEHEEDNGFNFFDEVGSCDDETIAGMLQGMVEAN